MDSRKKQKEGASSSSPSLQGSDGEGAPVCASKPLAGSSSRARSPSAGLSSPAVPTLHEAKTGKISPTSSPSAEQLEEEHRQQHAPHHDRRGNSSSRGREEESRCASETADSISRRGSGRSRSGSLASGAATEMERGGGDGEDTKDAEHFKMVAARFRALMDRRERRLEEAMSDPQTRMDLEAMFPGVLDGDYQTLLAGVRGMEEEDFQNLLSAARKRRREDERVAENSHEGGREAPKTGGAPLASSPSHCRSPSGSSRGVRPPSVAASEGGEGWRDRYHPQQHQHQEHQAALQRPHAFSAGPYVYSTSDPRGAAAGDHISAPHAVAATGGGRGGSVGRDGSGGRPPHPAADALGDNEGVFPHYVAPAGASRGDGRRSGGAHGGVRPPAWSRQQHPQHPHGPPPELHPVRGGGLVAVDGRVVAPSGALTGAVTTSAAASAAAAKRGGVISRAGAGGGYYDHPFYQREREPPKEGGMLRGGSVGGSRGAGGGRVPYTEAGQPPYARAPPSVFDRADRPISGGRGGGGGGRPRSPVHVAVRGGPRGHPSGPSDQGDPLQQSRYVRPAQPGINRALCEAVERVFQHREKLTRGGGGGGGGGRAAGDTDTDVERRAGVAGSSPALDAKKATMRIIAILESFDGRLNDMLADPRAMVELDAIFPGVEEREFRALLEGCIERLQSPQIYHKQVDRNYHGGERTYSRMEIERMYQERERAYQREHPDHPRYPHELPPGFSGPASPMYREVRDGGERFFVAPPPPHHAYPNHPGGGAGYRGPPDVYYQQRPGGGGAYAGQRLADGGGGGGFVRAKRELYEDPDGKAYDAGRESTYPKYPGPGGRFRQGFGPDENGGPPPPRRDGRMQHPPALSSHGRNGVRSVGGPASAAAAGVVPPLLYKAPSGQDPVAAGGGSLYHHRYQPDAHGGQDGGSSRHRSPPGSPRAHGRRGVDEAAHSLRRDARSRGGSAAPLPPVSAAGRAGPGTRGGGNGALSVDDDNDDDDDDDGSSASRSDSKPPAEGDGGVGRGRKARESGAPAGSGGEAGGEEPFCEVVRDASGVTRLFIPETPPEVPRRPPSKGNKRETLGDIAQRIPVSIMRPYFNYPLRTAAEAMNISVTTLKRLCRRHGVKRWPHRQISGINRAMAHLEFQQDQAGRRNCDKTNARNNQVSEQMQELLRRRKVMIEHAFESDDGGSRQPLKSSDSEDEGGDPESFSDTNLNHAFAKRRAIKAAAAVDTTVTDDSGGGGGGRARGHGHPTETKVAPAYNPATTDAAAATHAARGGRGRTLDRSLERSPSDDPQDGPSCQVPVGPPMQSRRRLLPPTRPGRPPSAPPRPLRQREDGQQHQRGEAEQTQDRPANQGHDEKEGARAEREDEAADEERRQQQQQQQQEQKKLKEEHGGDGGEGKTSEKEEKKKRDGGDIGDGDGDDTDDDGDDYDDEIGEGDGEEDGDDETVEEDEEVVSGAPEERRRTRSSRGGGGGGVRGEKQHLSRRSSSPSPCLSRRQQHQHQRRNSLKRKQSSPPDEQPPSQHPRAGGRGGGKGKGKGGLSSSTSSTSSNSSTSSSSASTSPVPADGSKEADLQKESDETDRAAEEELQQENEDKKLPVSKPRSPLTCGPRLAPGQYQGDPRGLRSSSYVGGGGDRDSPPSSSSSSSLLLSSAKLPELPSFSLAGSGGSRQEEWGAPTAPTPSTAQEA